MAVDLELLENLKDDSFEITSAPCEEYNCFAWAAGVTDQWWDPCGVWPGDLSADAQAGTFVELYERHGFLECNDVMLEAGYEKVALYMLGREVTHAARQLPSGKWTSKLGPDDDIVHDSLDDVAGSLYGHPARFLRRRITSAS